MALTGAWMTFCGVRPQSRGSPGFTRQHGSTDIQQDGDTREQQRQATLAAKDRYAPVLGGLLDQSPS